MVFQVLVFPIVLKAAQRQRLRFGVSSVGHSEEEEEDEEEEILFTSFSVDISVFELGTLKQKNHILTVPVDSHGINIKTRVVPKVGREKRRTDVAGSFPPGGGVSFCLTVTRF